MSAFQLCTRVSQFRFRYLEKPAQFGGTNCVGTLWDSLACPRATQQCLVPDYCEDSFTCKETGRFRQEQRDRTLPFAVNPVCLTAPAGRCISQSLRCNGEPDCDDFSDEDDCENIARREDKCSTLMSIPGAEGGIQG